MLYEITVVFIKDYIENVAQLIMYEGACLAGIIVYAAAKLFNITTNLPLGSFPEPLPDVFLSHLGNLFDGASFDNVYYVKHSNLATDFFSDTTLAMTFAGVTVGGEVPLNYVIFLKYGIGTTDVSMNAADRSLICHELVHVQQYRRFASEKAFACAYGFGFASAGFDYMKNPLEDEAFTFESVNATAIGSMF